MSTRCQIRFKFPDGNVLTYRHSDGYPSAVIPDLINFLKWNQGRNSQYDYVIPNYFYYMKRQVEEEYCKYEMDYHTAEYTKRKLGYIINRKMGGNEAVLLGFGLDYQNILHGDIEYFYDVEFIEKAVGDIFPGMSFKISVYETSNLPERVITPDQLVYDRPMMVINITDIANHKIPTRKFLEDVVDVYQAKKQAECAHEWSESPLGDYCGKCWIRKQDIPIEFKVN